MSTDAQARNIICRHNPENDIIPGMDRRASWAEAELAECVLDLLTKIQQLEERIYDLENAEPSQAETIARITDANHYQKENQ